MVVGEIEQRRRVKDGKRTEVYLSPETLHALKLHATDTGRPASLIVEDAIRDRLRREGRPLD